MCENRNTPSKIILFFFSLELKVQHGRKLSFQVGVLIHHLGPWSSFLCCIVHFVLLLTSLEEVTPVLGHLQVLYNHCSRFCPTQLKGRDLPVSSSVSNVLSYSPYSSFN